MFSRKKKTVFVGLSGGVDSSVAAALLKKRGFDVVGVFIKVWQPDFIETGAHRNRFGASCTWREDRRDAMRVAARLDIPFLTLNLEKEYKEKVIDYMIGEYKAGRTPNPDVMCNKYVKFGVFFKKAIEMGADFVATGHYARVKKRSTGMGEESMLLRGVDLNKDQTYFLWTLTQNELSRTLFPVGDYRKPYIRKLAQKFGLPTAQKKDSQGLCFVGKVDMRSFLSTFLPERRGKVLDEKGREIGWHYGAHFYTLGQRHGFTVTNKPPNNKPFFVVDKDIESNTIVVSHERGAARSSDGAHAKTRYTLDEVNWISSHTPDPGEWYTAAVRYRQKPQRCRVLIDEKEGTAVEFDSPQVAASGQSLVLYDGDECLGGGIIQ